jgi:hypothetical protein
MIWTILGVSVGVVAVFCVAVSELLVGRPAFEAHRAECAVALGIAGIILWLVGRRRDRKRQAAPGDDKDASPFMLLDLRYWGPMLIILGITTVFIQTLRQEQQLIVHARTPTPKPVPPPPKPVVVPVTNAPVVFPTLKLQGVIVRPTESFVIINGRSYGVGEQVEDVVVKEISRTGATIEKDGQTQTLFLGEVRPGGM